MREASCLVRLPCGLYASAVGTIEIAGARRTERPGQGALPKRSAGCFTRSTARSRIGVHVTGPTNFWGGLCRPSSLAAGARPVCSKMTAVAENQTPGATVPLSGSFTPRTGGASPLPNNPG
jgi:hypothetical protein